ncbi:hypothetical protein CDL12_24074 [Handroanthus impetiginosus]|uniref:Transmembrane protein n=1 Tax=Handroanthus impetiginosus TaxID=429701 RepID=A0A2G9GDP2_9LAMI|nr:hypothetical protein CDL12_24074 [Handroanthus impetiginosus]
MEDQSLEGEMMNYSPPLEDGEAEKSNLGMLLNTGLRLGKNLVITGVVISSVPLVLPPLAVISALGLAFSVSFGVVFASYACTQKLMSKLLPSPAPPSMSVSPYGDEEQVVANAVEKEEQEQREATKYGIEMRIEMVDNDDVNLKQSLPSTDERGYSDVGECSKDKDDELFVNNVKVDRLNEEARKQRSLEPTKDIEKPCLSAVGADRGTGGNASATEDHAVVLPELKNAEDRKSEGHGDTSSSVEDVKLTVPILQVQSDNLETEEREQNVTNKHEMENFSEEDKNKELEKTFNRIEGTEMDKKHKTLSKGMNSSKEIEGLGENRTSTAQRFRDKRKEPAGEKRSERLLGKETDLPEETKSSSDSNLNLCPDVESKFGSGEELRAEVVVQETSADQLDNSVSGEKGQAGELECTTLRSEYLDNKEILGESNHNVSLNDDVGNMDRSLQKEHKPVALEELQTGQSETAGGIDIPIEECPMMVYSEPGENDNESRMIADDGEYSFEAGVLEDMPESKLDEEIPELKDADNACKAFNEHSDEGVFCDEKIWEKMDAVRVIVGFKAPRHSSYFEELKALYLFTGIEPPSSFMDPSDLGEFYNKLHFLMSVIGLK